MRLVIYSSASAEALQHLLWRLETDVPDVEVAGVLFETGRPALARGRRLGRLLRLARHRDFLIYLASRARDKIRRSAETARDRVLRWIHAAPRHPNGPPLTLDALTSKWSSRGVRFHITPDLHDTASLAFVRALNPNIGLIYGTRILKPQLFTIPSGGSINIHKHKLPDYRGGGAPGLWEMRDGQSSMTVTVHRVVESVDAGAILGERTFPIEPLDTLESVGLKADLFSIDLLVDVLGDLALGRANERPQPAGGTVFKGYQPHQIAAVARRIGSSRPRWRPGFTRSLAKRLARTAALPCLALRNHRNRRRQRFPVTILFHHLTSDRPKMMGLPTAAFARHVRFLKTHYRIVSLHEAVALLESGVVAEPTVVLTFDDGYAENFSGLRAVAEVENVPVTICVCTQHVADRSELAHDIERGERHFPSLDWEQVRYLDRHRVTIASHTRTHFDCGTGDHACLLSEIAGSRADLEAALGHGIDVFAFPIGKPQNLPPAALRLALQHYSVVLSAAGGSNAGPVTLPAELRRHFHTDSLWELELQLQGILDPAVPCQKIAEGAEVTDDRNIEKRRSGETEKTILFSEN
jgi:methionyl-tRNA formyltransferase/peptidoglycan/xylan/chitin deacetylase (PgdA/CDA1 family)